MADAFRPGGLLDKPPAVIRPAPLTKAQRDSIHKEDVKLIVRCFQIIYFEWLNESDPQVTEFEIPDAQAERVLLEHKGNITDALRALVGL